MAISRWDPFAEMMTLRDAMNRLFEESFVSPSRLLSATGPRQFPLDVYERPDGLWIRAALPGVSPDQVQISFEQGMLTIRGTVPVPAGWDGNGKEGGTWHLRELAHGEFARSLRVPETFDPDKADATYEHGILTLHLPRTEAAKPRQIQVRAAAK